MPFQIIRNDITQVSADAIVNTANPRPTVGRGTDSAIYAAAGREELLAARREIGNIAPGKAEYTPAFALRAKYIIHTVGPAWFDGRSGEREILRSCYQNSLALAERLGCESVAFPLISAGSYGFPKDEALHIALSEIQRFLLSHEMLVTLVVFDSKALTLSESLVGAIDQYIDDHTARQLHRREGGVSVNRPFILHHRQPAPPAASPEVFGAPDHISASLEDSEALFEREEREEAPAMAPAPSYSMAAMEEKSLDEILHGAEKGFQPRLLQLIDESGMDDVTVYKKANIDRKLFSRIRCKPDYKPKKKTAVAFAIALELDMNDMTDLLSRAGIAISPSDTFDLIIAYFVSHRIYDIFEINAALFKYGQPILGE